MPSTKSIDELRKELAPLQNYTLIVYGSYVQQARTSRSDIDLAIITGRRDYPENVQLWKKLLGRVPAPYDLKVFELLPINIQISIIEQHQVIFGDPVEISAYFYGYRKEWNDVKHHFLENQFSGFREKIALMRRAKLAGLG